MCWINSLTSLYKICHHESNKQCHRGNNVKINERLSSYSPNLAKVASTGDAKYNCEEDHRCDDHFDHADEKIADQFCIWIERRKKPTDDNTQCNSNQYLDV